MRGSTEPAVNGQKGWILVRYAVRGAQGWDPREIPGLTNTPRIQMGDQQVARTAVLEPSVETAEEYSANIPETPVFATDYNADGEAVDRPVDTSRDVQTGLPGVEPDRPVEMFDGRQVTAWKYSLTGNVQVNRLNEAAATLFEAMRADHPVTLLVTVEPGSVAFKPNTEDGHIVGFTRERKLHVTEVWAADADASELFDGGLMRVRKSGPDDIGYLTEEPEDADEGNDLASSLMAAGLCGKRHKGHKNTCRVAAHACEEPEAEEDE